MVTQGEYREDGARFGLILNYDKEETELVLVSSGNVWSSFKTSGELEFCYGNTKAKQVFALIQKGIKGCTAKNAMPAPFVKGTVSRHTFKKSKVDYRIDRYNGQLAGAEVIDIEKNIYISLEYYEGPNIIPEIPYIKMTVEQEFSDGMSEEEAVRTRTLEEISLEKDVTWLKNKKYYIVNDDETADRIISIIENYKGVVSYDTETTGLKMNMFSKVNSKWQKELNEYNAGKPKEEQIRADRLVGVIFCVEKDISYYFPVFNRKFRNVFEDVNSPVRNRIANNIKTFYTIGEGRTLDHDMARYFRDTPINEMTPDTLFMERCRKLLETCSLGAHHGSFEWAVSWCYNIDINLVDDSMILHQLMYKFRSTTSNKGEPSNLKYLTKREFGIDQLDLEDFFVGYKEDESGEVRGSKKKKKKKTYIDFSYMDYEGAQAYAPADGDFTLGLIYKYKYDLVTNHPELEYLYHVEVLVACAIGYMEFYGHRLDEEKINRVRDNNRRKMLEIEHQIRGMAGASEEAETSAFAELTTLVSKIEALDEEISALKSNPELNSGEIELKQTERESLFRAREEQELNCRKAIAESSHEILLSSPAQVANLFYDEDKMNIPCPEDKKSVAKKTLKPLLKMRNEDGSDKYPIVHLYTEWKKLDTLLTKFFDNLQNFMYPGGFIFSSYGQISTATGRMSCIEENTQIRLVGGQKAIKDVKVGDLVYCYDEEGNIRIKKVLNVIDNGYRDCIKLNWESQGTHNRGELICTPDHKIRLTDGSWAQAGEISHGSRLTHLRVSDAKRPVVYGANGFYRQEQLIIKKEIFGYDEYDMVIHHKDDDTSNNQIDNLEIKTRKTHSSDHGKERAEAGLVEYKHLIGCPHRILSGEEHPNYRSSTADELIDMLIAANGVLTSIPMDFGTFKKKCEERNVDYKSIMAELRRQYKEFDDAEFIESYKRNNGVVYAISQELDIGRTRVASAITRLGLSKKEYKFLDNEYIECFFNCNGDWHMIAEHIGITVREVQENNRRLHCVITGIDDAEFIDAFYRLGGKLRGVAREFGITFYKAKENALRLNLCTNHKLISSEHAGVRHVYDLEVEDCHNFIANEICVHNCSKPNAQQYPKDVTGIVIPRDNYVLFDADFSQIEYRTLVAMAKEEHLAETFKDPDSDYHTLMASLMYSVPYASVTPKMRSDAKSFNFGIPYGMGFKSLAILLTGMSNEAQVEEAKVKYELYFKDQPKVRRFFENVKESALVNKYTQTYFGRRRYYSFVDKDGNASNKRKAMALRQAGNAIIQGTAADIFKISVARNFTYIRNNGLLGLVLIINMIHDEQLMEINCEMVNVQRALRDIVNNMEFKISGFPPLYVGAGIGMNWKDAKGKMAEIHPNLAEQLSHEADNMNIWTEHPVAPKEVLDYFNKRVYEFRFNKVKDYLTNPENFGKDLHPAIGNLINLQFTFGLDKLSEEDRLAGKEPLKGDELTQACVAKFIEVNNLNVNPNLFKANEQARDVEEDDGYEDDEDEFEESEEGAIFGTDFALIDDDDSLYGVSLQDLISLFGLIVSSERKVCGIDIKIVPYQKKEEMFDYLENHACEPEDEGAMQVIFLRENNVLYRTQVWVKGIDGSAMSTKLRLNAIAYR